MKIYHPTEGTREIPSIDFTDLWRSLGWAAAPVEPTPEPGPQLLEPDPPEPELFDPVKARTAELEALLADQGWDEIKRIAEGFDPPVPKGDTWGKTIPDIVEREKRDGIL